METLVGRLTVNTLKFIKYFLIILKNSFRALNSPAVCSKGINLSEYWSTLLISAYCSTQGFFRFLSARVCAPFIYVKGARARVVNSKSIRYQLTCNGNLNTLKVSRDHSF